MKLKIIKSLIAIGLLAPVMAIAMPIEGSIRMGGDATPGCAVELRGEQEPEPCDLGNADAIIFTNGVVVGADGDFAPALFANTEDGSLSLNDFSIDPFAGPVTIWEVFPNDRGALANFRFQLDELFIVDQNPSTLLLRGNGVVSGAGFDDTSGVWSFSAQDLPDGRSINFSWSSETAQAPEPGILLLLGAGLIGLIRTRRA